MLFWYTLRFRRFPLCLIYDAYTLVKCLCQWQINTWPDGNENGDVLAQWFKNIVFMVDIFIANLKSPCEKLDYVWQSCWYRSQRGVTQTPSCLGCWSVSAGPGNVIVISLSFTPRHKQIWLHWMALPSMNSVAMSHHTSDSQKTLVSSHREGSPSQHGCSKPQEMMGEVWDLSAIIISSTY